MLTVKHSKRIFRGEGEETGRGGLPKKGSEGLEKKAEE